MFAAKKLVEARPFGISVRASRLAFTAFASCGPITPVQSYGWCPRHVSPPTCHFLQNGHHVSTSPSRLMSLTGRRRQSRMRGQPSLFSQPACSGTPVRVRPCAVEPDAILPNPRAVGRSNRPPRNHRRALRREATRKSCIAWSSSLSPHQRAFVATLKSSIRHPYFFISRKCLGCTPFRPNAF
jgi:hypothetical protein